MREPALAPLAQAPPVHPLPHVLPDLRVNQRRGDSDDAAGEGPVWVVQAPAELRAYPGRGAAITAFQVMRAQARWRKPRWFSGFFDQRMRSARERLSQEWVRSTTQRRARKPASRAIALASSPRQRMWAVKPKSTASSRTSS